MIFRGILFIFTMLAPFSSFAEGVIQQNVLVSERMDLFLQNSHSMIVSEKNHALNEVTSQLFSQGSTEYKKTLNLLKNFWNTDPILSQSALLKFQREWEYKMSPRFWRQARLRDSSRRYVPLIFLVNVLTPAEESGPENFNSIRWSKDVYSDSIDLPYPAPVSVLSDLPVLQRLEPVSMEEFLQDQQMREIQATLETLGTTGAGLLILRNTRGIRAVSKGNPLKFTPVGLLITALAIGASEGIIAWADNQSVVQVEQSVHQEHLSLEGLDDQSSNSNIDLQYKAFETAVKNYALRLILPIFEKINDNNDGMARYSEKQQQIHEVQDELISLKIQWLEQKLSGVETPEVESDQRVFQEWVRFVENLVREFQKIAEAGDKDAEERAQIYLNEQLEGLKQELSTSSENLEELLFEKETRLNNKLRKTTFDTLFQRRARSCSYEFFRNQWLEQIGNQEESAPHLPMILKHYAIYYRPEGTLDPVEKWMKEIINPVVDPASMVDYVQMDVTGRFLEDHKDNAPSLAQQSIQTTTQQWQEKILRKSYCGNPVVFLDQVLLWLQTQAAQRPEQASAAQKISNNIKTLRHGLYVQLEALLTPPSAE